MATFVNPRNLIEKLPPEQLDDILKTAGQHVEAELSRSVITCDFLECHKTYMKYESFLVVHRAQRGLTPDSGNVWQFCLHNAYIDVCSGWSCCALVCKEWSVMVANYMTKARSAKMLLQTETYQLYRHAKQKGEATMYTAVVHGHTCVFSLETQNHKLMAIKSSNPDRLLPTAKSKPQEVAKMVFFEMLRTGQLEFNAEDALGLMKDVPKTRRPRIYRWLSGLQTYDFRCYRIDSDPHYINAVYRISTRHTAHIAMVHGPELFKEQTLAVSIDFLRYGRAHLAKLKERPPSSMSRKQWIQLVIETYTHLKTKLVSERECTMCTHKMLCNDDCSTSRQSLLLTTIHGLSNLV
jgi:hypothetical protein